MKRHIQYAVAIAACGIILLTLAAVEEVLMQGIWRPFDIASYYGLAGFAVSSIEAALGASPATSVIMFDIDGLRMPLVSLLIWACTALVIAIGGRLFGDTSGYLAGLLFTLSAGGAQGNLAAGDALALTLALASVYCVLCFEKRYLAAGLLAGAAACLKPLVIILLPLSLLYIYRQRRLRGTVVYGAAWALLPVVSLVLIVMMLYRDYGSSILTMAVYNGFSAFGFMSGGSYRPDALMAAANIALAACMLASLLPLALLGFYRTQGLAGKYLLAAGLFFIATLPLKQYLAYWLFALPFLALLCASPFAGRPADG